MSDIPLVLFEQTSYWLAELLVRNHIDLTDILASFSYFFLLLNAKTEN